jgi:hypothetical protein
MATDLGPASTGFAELQVIVKLGIKTYVSLNSCKPARSFDHSLPRAGSLLQWRLGPLQAATEPAQGGPEDSAIPRRPWCRWPPWPQVFRLPAPATHLLLLPSLQLELTKLPALPPVYESSSNALQQLTLASALLQLLSGNICRVAPIGVLFALASALKLYTLLPPPGGLCALPRPAPHPCRTGAGAVRLPQHQAG